MRCWKRPPKCAAVAARLLSVELRRAATLAAPGGSTRDTTRLCSYVTLSRCNVFGVLAGKGEQGEGKSWACCRCAQVAGGPRDRLRLCAGAWGPKGTSCTLRPSVAGALRACIGVQLARVIDQGKAMRKSSKSACDQAESLNCQTSCCCAPYRALGNLVLGRRPALWQPGGRMFDCQLGDSGQRRAHCERPWGLVPQQIRRARTRSGSGGRRLAPRRSSNDRGAARARECALLPGPRRRATVAGVCRAPPALSQQAWSSCHV